MQLHPFELESLETSQSNIATIHTWHFRRLFKVNEKISIDLVLNGWNKVLETFEPLRFQFEQSNDGCWIKSLRNLKENPIGCDDVEFLDLSQTTNQLQLHYMILERSHQEAQNLKPIGKKSPLFKWILIQTNSNEQFLLSISHHLGFDESCFWSLYIPCFKSALKNETYILKHPPFTYNEYCLLLRQYANSDRCKRNVNYWKKFFSENSMFQIPSDSQFNGMVHRYRIEFGAKLSFEFYKKCQNQNVKPSTALLTSILITIAKKYGMNSGILRTIFHCRSMSPDLSQKQEKCDLTNLAGWIAQPSFELFKIDLKENLSENQKSVQAVFDNVPTGGIDYFASKWLTPDGRKYIDGDARYLMEYNFAASNKFDPKLATNSDESKKQQQLSIQPQPIIECDTKLNSMAFRKFSELPIKDPTPRIILMAFGDQNGLELDIRYSAQKHETISDFANEVLANAIGNQVRNQTSKL